MHTQVATYWSENEVKHTYTRLLTQTCIHHQVRLAYIDATSGALAYTQTCIAYS